MQSPMIHLWGIAIHISITERHSWQLTNISVDRKDDCSKRKDQWYTDIPAGHWVRTPPVQYHPMGHSSMSSLSPSEKG